ncbi:hypothetical protein [Moraxella lacunata]|uniref:hypothetical protein n=1 Tax=Moraxella lacunata TaxID=477 RepID=UPI003EE30540
MQYECLYPIKYLLSQHSSRLLITRNKTANFLTVFISLFPLNRRRRFATDIIDNTRHIGNLIHDTS